MADCPQPASSTERLVEVFHTPRSALDHPYHDQTYKRIASDMICDGDREESEQREQQLEHWSQETIREEQIPHESAQHGNAAEADVMKAVMIAKDEITNAIKGLKAELCNRLAACEEQLGELEMEMLDSMGEMQTSISLLQQSLDVIERG